MTAPLPLALCGIGRFAERRILPALAACPDIRVSAVISRTRAAFACDGRAVPVFPTLDAFLQTRPSGAVYILTPNALHAPQSIAALTVGLDVLCEKPIATSSHDAARMLDAARAAGRHLQIAHVLRDSAAMRTLADWLADGRIGAVTDAHAEVDFDLPPSARSWVDDPHLAGGGVLLDLGVHCVDLFQWLFGGPLMAEAAAFDRAAGAATETGVTAAFRAGAVRCRLTLHNGRSFKSRLAIQGERGRIVVDAFTASWGEAVLECPEADVRTSVDVSASYQRQLAGFAARVQRPPDYRATEDAVAGLRLIESLYHRGRHPS